MRIIPALAITAILGCQTQQPAESKAVPTAAPTAKVDRDAQSPIEVTVRPIELAQRTATLEVVVSKLVATEQPLRFSLRLPVGVEAVPADLRPVGGAEVGRFTQSIQLRFAQLPISDVVVVVDSQGTSLGYHAELAYRFGRPEPKVEQPVRSPDTIKVGGHELGQPIELTPGTGK